jgi:predicted metalloprotease
MRVRRLAAIVGAAVVSLLGPAALPAQAAPAEQPTASVAVQAIAGSSPDDMYGFLETWILDIGGYWSSVPDMAPFAYYSFPAPGESVESGCDVPTDDDSAFYCPVDDTVYVSQSLSARIWDGTFEVYPGQFAAAPAGDTGVLYVLGHEYAHNVQTEVGLYGDPLSSADDPYPLINTELHADCWSGVYLRAKLDAGQLEEGDPEEAIWAAARVGDYAYDDPGHHGTPDQRVAAFKVGYDSGQPIACDEVLQAQY